MTQATETTVTTDTTVTVKAPSKKSLATAIFNQKLADRAAGKFASNKDFRAAVLSTIVADLGVSMASASTMYNACKQEAQAADETVALGRDPKIVKVKVQGAKRGRPAKEIVAVTVTTENTAVVTEEAVAA